MTIALRIGNEDSQVKGFIYLDAVVSYTKTLSGKVTKFPVDSGVNIADHFISENQKISFEGVVSDVDITGYSDLVQIDGEKPMNAHPRPAQPTITGHTNALQYLPSSVRQFFERSEASVTAPSEAQNNTPAVEALLTDLMAATFYNEVDKKWRNKMTFTTLYEMSGTNFSNAITNLVITDVSFSETPDSGDALTISFSLEKVRLVTLDKTEMPKKAKPAVKKKVASKESQGKQSCPMGQSDTNSVDTNINSPKVKGSGSAIEKWLEAKKTAGGN